MLKAVNIVGGIVMRPLALNDANALAAAYLRNRIHLAPWEPSRDDNFFTETAQSQDIATRIASSAQGSGYSLGLFDGVTVVGRLNLAGLCEARSRAQGSGTG